MKHLTDEEIEYEAFIRLGMKAIEDSGDFEIGCEFAQDWYKENNPEPKRKFYDDPEMLEVLRGLWPSYNTRVFSNKGVIQLLGGDIKDAKNLGIALTHPEYPNAEPQLFIYDGQGCSMDIPNWQAKLIEKGYWPCLEEFGWKPKQEQK